MASGDGLCAFNALHNMPPDWLWVAFTGGSVEPVAGGDGTAVIWGDTSDANAVLEYLVLTSGTWGGGDAAGYMLLSNWDRTAWSSGEDFTADNDTPADHGTLTSVPVNCAATFDSRNSQGRLDFDAAVNELAVIQLFMPRNYDGGGVIITLGAAASSATTNDMSWATFFKSVSDNADNLDEKNFADPQVNQAVDAPTTLGNVRYFTITHTDGAQMDSVAAGEMFFLMIMRDAQDSTNDDMAGDGEWVFGEIQEV